MRNNETGEFELVVGNRQLLSAFFIIVLLFAVAFAMGYVVGENSRSTKTAETPSTATPTRPAEPRPEPVAAKPPAAETETPAAKPAESPAQPTTQPAHEAQTRPADASTDTSSDLAPGAYWQIIATANRDSAQTIMQTLRDKGFPALLGPGPNNLTRVLVGPYIDNTAMGRAKSELEGAGFNKLVTFRR